MWLRCEIANGYYGNGKGNKSLVLLEWGNDGGGEMRPKPFLGYYPQLAVSLTPRLSHFLWSPPVSFVFSLLRLSFSFLSPAFPSLSLSVSLSVCLSVLWDGGVRSSWVRQGERERVREGKSVRARRCERGSWEKGGGKERGEGKLARESERGERRKWEREWDR